MTQNKHMQYDDKIKIKIKIKTKTKCFHQNPKRPNSNIKPPIKVLFVWTLDQEGILTLS